MKINKFGEIVINLGNAEPKITIRNFDVTDGTGLELQKYVLIKAKQILLEAMKDIND